MKGYVTAQVQTWPIGAWDAHKPKTEKIKGYINSSVIYLFGALLPEGLTKFLRPTRIHHPSSFSFFLSSALIFLINPSPYSCAVLRTPFSTSYLLFHSLASMSLPTTNFFSLILLSLIGLSTPQSSTLPCVLWTLIVPLNCFPLSCSYSLINMTLLHLVVQNSSLDIVLICFLQLHMLDVFSLRSIILRFKSFSSSSKYSSSIASCPLLCYHLISQAPS